MAWSQAAAISLRMVFSTIVIINLLIMFEKKNLFGFKIIAIKKALSSGLPWGF